MDEASYLLFCCKKLSLYRFHILKNAKAHVRLEFRAPRNASLRLDDNIRCRLPQVYSVLSSHYTGALLNPSAD